MKSNEVKILKIELSKIKKFKFDYRYIPIKDDNVDKHLILIWEAITFFEYSLPDLFANKEQWLYRRMEMISAQMTSDLKKILITKYAGYLSDVVDYDVTVEIDNFNKVFNKILEIKKQKIHSFQLLKNNNEIEVEILDSTIVHFEIGSLKVELVKLKGRDLNSENLYYMALDGDNSDEYLILIWEILANFSSNLKSFLKRRQLSFPMNNELIAVEFLDQKTLRLGELAPSYEEREYDLFIDIEYDNFLEVFNKYDEFRSLNIYSFQLTRDDNKISIDILEKSSENEGLTWPVEIEESKFKPKNFAKS